MPNMKSARFLLLRASLWCVILFSCAYSHGMHDHPVRMVRQFRCSNSSSCHCHVGAYPGLPHTDVVLIADCSHQALDQIPQDLPEDIDVLVANHNPDISLASSSYQLPYSKLSVLAMHECNIKNLHTKAFAGLDSLNILDLYSSHTGIEIWSEMALAGLPNLRVLNVTVGNIRNEPFSNSVLELENLKELSITFLHSNLSETSDILSGLHLSTLQVVVVNAMYLPDRFLTPMEPTDLKSLHVHSSSLRAIPQGFLNEYLTTLEVFKLTSTYIPLLPNDLFALASEDDGSGDWYTAVFDRERLTLEEIHISGVSVIGDKMFPELQELRKLTIKNFHDLSDTAFSGLSLLQELTIMNSDSFSKVSDALLRKVYELTDLKISHTQIHTLTDVSLMDNFELVYLDLSNNKLQNLDSYTFSSMNLQHLDLSGNMLDTIKYQTFEIYNLIKLDLSYNRITELDEGIFSDLYDLHELNLRGNKLRDLPVGIFDSFHSIRWLDLGHNRFANFSPLFIQGCPELQLLDLTGNPVYAFHMTEIEGVQDDLEVKMDEMPVVTAEPSTPTPMPEISSDSSSSKAEAQATTENPESSTPVPNDNNTKDEGTIVPKSSDGITTAEKNDVNPVASTNLPKPTETSKVPSSPSAVPPILLPRKKASNKSSELLTTTPRSDSSPLPSHWNHSALFITLAVFVCLSVLICVVLVIYKRRKSNYYRVSAVGEASPAEESHRVGPGGEGAGRNTIVRFHSVGDEEGGLAERLRFV